MERNLSILKVEDQNNFEELKEYNFWPINSYCFLSQYYKNIMLFDYSYYYKFLENSFNLTNEFETFNNSLHRELINFLNKRKDTPNQETINMLEKIVNKMEDCNESYFFLLEDYNKSYCELYNFYTNIEEIYTKLTQLISYTKNKYELLLENDLTHINSVIDNCNDDLDKLIIFFSKDKTFFGQKIFKLIFLLKENDLNIDDLQMLFFFIMEYYETYLCFLKKQMQSKEDNEIKIKINHEKCLSYIKDNENICLLIKSFIGQE